MKVKELIKKLKKEDPEMDLVRSGYEGGFDDIDSISKIKIKDNENTEWWYGKHERVSDDEPFDREVILL